MKMLLAVMVGLVLVGCGKNEPASKPVAESAVRVCSTDETHDQPQTYEAVRDLAMKGNYQAQRNLAYGYVGGFPYKGQDVNPILGCAWYKYIMLSGGEKVNSTDAGNAQVYCGRLPEQERAAAEAQMQALIGKLCR